METENRVVLRDMRPGEEQTLVGLARRAFTHSPFEQIAIGRPHTALVAEVDGTVAGAAFIKVYESGGEKTGYLDVAYVVKAYRGRGVARLLYPAAVERLREMGCRHVCAMVIDDNVASWKPLQNAGFGAVSFCELARAVGAGAAFTLWLRTLFCAATGARLWMDAPVKEKSSLGELATFIGLNLLLFLPGLLRMLERPGELVARLLAFPCVLLAGALFGGLGSLVAGGKWWFSFPRGGALLALGLNSLGNLFPMAGRWYPQKMQATKECRRAMGVQAVFEWAGMLAIFALGAFVLGAKGGFVYQCAALAANLLIYRLIPFMPFGAFGGTRVWNWNKAVFAAFAVVTAVLVFLVL